MKKSIIMLAIITTFFAANAQTNNLQATVQELDKASTVKDYQRLSEQFMEIARMQKTQWLSYYYAAYCNAKIGWIKQDADPDNIEAFANKAEEQINKAKTLLDTTKQQKELSEVYCVYSMLNRSKVYINP